MLHHTIFSVKQTENENCEENLANPWISCFCPVSIVLAGQLVPRLPCLAGQYQLLYRPILWAGCRASRTYESSATANLIRVLVDQVAKGDAR
jgi:hypothetical protein